MTDPFESLPAPTESDEVPPDRRSIRIGPALLGVLSLLIAGWVLSGGDFTHQNTSTLTWVVIAVAATAGLSLIVSGWRKKN